MNIEELAERTPDKIAITELIIEVMKERKELLLRVKEMLEKEQVIEECQK